MLVACQQLWRLRHRAVLSVTTFWTSVREFSPLWTHGARDPRIAMDSSGDFGVISVDSSFVRGLTADPPDPSASWLTTT